MNAIPISPAQRHREQAEPPATVTLTPATAVNASPDPATWDPVLRLNKVIACVGLSRSAIYRRMDDGDFPRPLDLGGNAIGWRLSTINQWLAARPVR